MYPIENLSKILVDEKDNISPFRKALKDLIIHYEEYEDNLVQMQQDILRPEIDKINRQFKHYTNTHRLGVAASLGAFTLSLVKFLVPEAEISKFINEVIGGTLFAGAGWLFSEREYQSKMNSLRDNPYFLLWRIKKGK